MIGSVFSEIHCSHEAVSLAKDAVGEEFVQYQAIAGLGPGERFEIHFLRP